MPIPISPDAFEHVSQGTRFGLKTGRRERRSSLESRIVGYCTNRGKGT